MIASAPPPATFTVSSRLARAGLVVGIWSAMSAVSLASTVLQFRTEGVPVPWSRLASDIAGWYLWLPLLPAVWWAARRFPLDRRALGRNVAAQVLCGLGVAAVYAVLVVGKNQLVVSLATGRFGVELLAMLPGHLFGGLPLYFLVYALIAAVLHAVEYYRRFREREVRASRLEARLAEARLQVLKMQLDPHFLFNALNAASALVLSDARGAERMIERLADFLRVSLAHAARQEVRLRQELGFLDLYLDIERVRFGERLRVETSVPEGLLDAIVPNLSLQPLVENSVRHGMRAQGLRIDVTAVALGANAWELRVEDDGLGLADTRSPDSGARSSRGLEGVGLSNVRRRLEHLYGAGAQLRLEARPGGGTSAVMRLPLHRGEIAVVPRVGWLGSEEEDEAEYELEFEAQQAGDDAQAAVRRSARP